jgi:lysophospholipase L1-like esterase
MSWARPVSAETSRPAALPGLPAGWPTTVELGSVDDPGDATALAATAPFGFRYHYLAGGVNTGQGWATWDPDGQFVPRYIAESTQHGMIPVFSYYMIRQSAPGKDMAEADGVHANLGDTSTMAAYFNDLKLFYQRAGAFPGTMVVLHVEPDMWGYIEQRARNDDASTVPARVAATGLPELTGLPDDATGVARAVVTLRDLYAPNVVLAYSVSVWGTGVDIAVSDPADATVDALAVRAARFYRSLQAAFDISFGEFADRDSAFKQYVEGYGQQLWWDAADFGRHARFLGKFVADTQTRVVLWGIPLGNTKMRAMDNTWSHYQDNRVEWLLDDPTRAHLSDYVEAGVVAFLFGGGADGQTCACDGAHDGITNPQPINGNVGQSLTADDDGGFFRQKAAEYYATGVLSLPAVADGLPAPESARSAPSGSTQGSTGVTLTKEASAPARSGVLSRSEDSPAPLPLISRKVPAYTSATDSPYGPQRANDDDYGTYWRSVAMPAWLAYDLSGVPIPNRTQVVVAWYNGTGDYDHTVGGGVGYNVPGSYTIEGNAAAGGTEPPASDWVTLESVTGNTYHSRQHVLDLTGYNWIRISVTASDGSPQNDDVSLNLDVHDASQGVADDWIFYGDSIVAAAMGVWPNGGVGTFAQLINARVPSQFPVQEAGGIGYLRSDVGARRIGSWLSLFPGRYVALSYGTNDCGATSPDAFYANYVSMVEAVLRAGKVPAVSKIPWARTPAVQTNGPALNAKIDDLYAAYPQIVRGPDFWTYFKEHPNLISQDNLHPSPEGEAAYRQLWADQMASAVYGAPMAAARP